nr:class I SAM-dependent methyltransferase [Treponemataceae bacterium]
YGPYLSAASDCNWIPFGMEISSAACDYVNSNLNFMTLQSNFQEKLSDEVFTMLKEKKLDAITMWYVIEHFENLDTVLENVKSILRNKGIFAFSTPSRSGVSGIKNTANFYKESPSDHFSIWSPKIAKKILKQKGFKVVKIVSTGIHPERFPYIKKHNLGQNSFAFKFLKVYSKLFKKGDTFEIYCVNKNTMEK